MRIEASEEDLQQRQQQVGQQPLVVLLTSYPSLTHAFIAASLLQFEDPEGLLREVLSLLQAGEIPLVLGPGNPGGPVRPLDLQQQQPVDSAAPPPAIRLWVNGDAVVTGRLCKRSDERVKDKMQALEPQACLEALNRVSSKRYELRQQQGEHFGFSAQELQEDPLLGQLVHQEEGEEALLSVDYDGMIAVLWSACKALEGQENRRVESLEGQEDRRLDSLVGALNRRMDGLLEALAEKPEARISQDAMERVNNDLDTTV